MFKVIILISVLFTASLWVHEGIDDPIIKKDKAIAANPQNAKLYFERALLYEMYLDFDKALLDNNRVEKVQADFADYNFQVGRFCYLQRHLLRP